MNIEADSLRYDDVRQISVFTGRVVVTKGSIVLRGAQIEVRQDPEGFQYGVVTSGADARAFFRQKRDRPWTSSSKAKATPLSTTARPTPCASSRRRSCAGCVAARWPMKSPVPSSSMTT